MTIHHRLLHRMQLAIARGDMLDRHDMTAVERAHEANAGIDAILVGESLMSQPDIGAAVDRLLARA